MKIAMRICDAGYSQLTCHNTRIQSQTVDREAPGSCMGRRGQTKISKLACKRRSRRGTGSTE